MSISAQAGASLHTACTADKAVQCTLTAWLLRAPVFDVASMLLAALAIGTVAGGALLVGMDHQYMLRLPISSTVRFVWCHVCTNVTMYAALRSNTLNDTANTLVAWACIHHQNTLHAQPPLINCLQNLMADLFLVGLFKHTNVASFHHTYTTIHS